METQNTFQVRSYPLRLVVENIELTRPKIVKEGHDTERTRSKNHWERRRQNRTLKGNGDSFESEDDT